MKFNIKNTIILVLLIVAIFFGYRWFIGGDSASKERVKQLEKEFTELENKKKLVDLEINKLLAQRFFLCTCIAIEKKENNLPIIDGVSKGKRKELYTRILGEYGDAIYETIHEQSIKIQISLLAIYN